MVNGQLIMYEGEIPEFPDIPVNQDLPALAYSKDGSGPIVEWLVPEHRWNNPAAPEETGIFGDGEGIFGDGGGIFGT